MLGYSSGDGARVAATIGALVIALIAAGFTEYVYDIYMDFVVVHWWRTEWFRTHPPLLQQPSLHVLCALLIPVGTLWWRPPASSSKRIVACFVGIAMALIPVVIEVIMQPFVWRSHARWAVAIVTVASAALLAIIATTRILKELDSPIVPPHIRRGLTRLYVAVFIPWIVWFGYDAYKANTSIRFDMSQNDNYARLLFGLDDPARTESARRQLEVMKLTWDNAATYDEIGKRIDKAFDSDQDRLTSAIYVLLAGIIPLLLYPIFVWILAGFQPRHSIST